MPLDPTPVPNELRGLRIALLVCGGIAAYKVVDLASALTQAGCEVRVAMTPSATRFVGPPTFQGVTGNPALAGLFDAGGSPEPHVALGDWAQRFWSATGSNSPRPWWTSRKRSGS